MRNCPIRQRFFGYDAIFCCSFSKTHVKCYCVSNWLLNYGGIMLLPYRKKLAWIWCSLSYHGGHLVLHDIMSLTKEFHYKSSIEPANNNTFVYYEHYIRKALQQALSGVLSYNMKTKRSHTISIWVLEHKNTAPLKNTSSPIYFVNVVISCIPCENISWIFEYFTHPECYQGDN